MAGDGHDVVAGQGDDAFPDFNPLLAYYMAKETDQFLRKTLFENNGTFAELLLADYTYANGPLAAFYGVPGPAERTTGSASSWIPASAWGC